MKYHYIELLKLGILTTAENILFQNKKYIINESKQSYYKEAIQRNQSNIRGI